MYKARKSRRSSVRSYDRRLHSSLDDPIAWTYDPASRAFELQWHADASISAPTVILAPSRLYSAGVNVECGGCAVEVVGNEVRLGAVSGDPAIARITPR
jgi:hypothetical protein